MSFIDHASKNEIHGKLLTKGMHVKDFAEKYGFKPRTVQQVISRHAGKPIARRGRLTKAILKKLDEEITTPPTPGPAQPAANG